MSDGAEKLLAEMVGRFSVRRAVDWLRVKFPSFDTSHGEPLECAASKNEKDYFAEAQLLGFVGRLSENGTSVTNRTTGTKPPVAGKPGKPTDAKAGKLEAADVAEVSAVSVVPESSVYPNRPLVVAAIKMKRELTERTSRLVQFNYAKKVLQGAISKSALGFSGIPSQGLFFFYDKDGYFRLSLVTAEVEKRKLKWNEAKRQSFYIEPGAANNIVKRRLADPIRSFADLKDAFSVEQLTKEFYRKLFDWYSWAMEPATNVYFPNDLADDTDDRKYNNEAIIRLITRLMFTWFIRQRKLVPDALFDREGVAGLLKKFDADSMERDNYYRAILQNLFFATFNCQPAKRRFIHTFQGKSGERHVTTLYRYEREFKGGDGSAFKALMKTVPFLNCALFDCLDKKEREEDGGRELYFDGFSGEKGHAAHLPNGLFFDDERGIISLFNRYEFTVNENDADDSDVALDPELLGKVFENLLGAFNPETQETARKATGSFYTPREIVDYMVEESLKGYLRGRIAGTNGTPGTNGTFVTRAAVTDVPVGADVSESQAAALADLFDRNKAAEGAPTLFTKKEEEALLDALYSCKILDPACGSGAFPMGVLHCMVRLLTRLDPQNISIRERLLKRYREDKAGLTAEEDRAAALAELEARLKEGQHYPDYERKLYLIENCIYGVDIQPIATQISKLRFFISLLCDQLRTSYDPTAENFGLLSLPNLEAKFVCANTLISLPEVGALDASIGNIADLRRDLQANRHKIFSARSTNTKEKYKAKDLAIRDAIRKTVRDSLSKPDEEAIKKWREKIEDAEKRREAVAEPDWVEEYEQVQTDLFAAFEKKKVKRDRNAKERAAIDAEIDWAKDKIAQEQAKGDLSNVGAATRYADMVAGWDPYDQNKSEGWFDPEWMFNITGGFDVVIGNPPYIRPHHLPSVVKESLWQQFATFEKKADIYVCFMEKGIRLLSDDGHLAYIVSDGWLRLDSFEKIRDFLLDNVEPKKIIDFTADVFETATVKTCIAIFKKGRTDDAVVEATMAGDCSCLKELPFSQIPIEVFRDSYKKIFDLSFSNASQTIKVKMQDGNKCIGETFDLSFGIKTGDDEQFLTFDGRRKNAKKLLRGADIGRYEFAYKGEYVIFEPDKMRANKQTARPGSKERYEQPKVLMRDTGGGLMGIFDSENYYVKDVIIVSSPRKDEELLKALLGILNSAAMRYYYETTFPTLHVQRDEIASLPIPAVLQSEHCKTLSAQIAALVDRILEAKKADPSADTTALESEIDALVYKLYGLTDEEIAVVEGRDKAGQQVAIPDSQSPATSPRKRGRVAAVEEQAADDDEVLE